jgi:hypothetical protein
VRIAQICRPLAESDGVVGLDFHNRENQHLEVAVPVLRDSIVGEARRRESAVGC